MMATLTFDLGDPDDVLRHKQCMEAKTMALALYNFKEKLRSHRKYDLAETRYSIDSISEEFYECIDGIYIEELIN